MRAFWLMWMWWVRTMAALSAGLFVWGAIAGSAAAMAVGSACTVANTVNAEFIRRRCL